MHRFNSMLALFVVGTSLALTDASYAETPVPATAAYREAYGPPPKTDAPQCLAAVAYLPGVGASGSPERLAPLPLFSANPENVLQEAARVVVEGYPVAPRFIQLPRVFPAASKLLGVEVEGGVASVRVGAGLPEPAHPLAHQALAYTLAQFDEIESVRLLVLGSAPVGPVSPKPGIIEPPPPPRLLDVVSTIHEGEVPEEVDILFDRPVSVSSFTIRLAEGTGLPGKTYTSMFDMAVVYRPQDPKIIRDGLPLQVIWAVRDKSGRVGNGEKKVELRIHRHPK
jgi:hypothetical protein